MKAPPRWIVPFESGPVADGDPRMVVSVTDELLVDITTENGVDPPVLLFPSLVALHLGAAIQSAAVWCGQEKSRREARKR